MSEILLHTLIWLSELFYNSRLISKISFYGTLNAMHLKHKNTITTAIMQLLLFCKIMVDMQKILFAALIDCLQIEK